MIALISTDFDGTLHADHEDPPVPADLQAHLARLQAAGGRWVINTGRDLSGLLEGLARARLSVAPDYVVTVEREIFVRKGAAYTSLEGWNDRSRAAHRALFERIRPDLPGLHAWIGAHRQATVYQDAYSPFCVIAQDNAEMDAIQLFLEEYCARAGGLAAVRNDIYCRFSHIDFNKGTALGEIARQLGLAPAQVLAAGDHYNDLPMLSLRHAGCLVAPSNAIAQVKEAVLAQGGYVSHQPWGHGVARGLEHYLGPGGEFAGAPRRP